MASKPNIDSIDDEDELYKLMNKTDDFEERKKIRARMRDIREAKSAEFERQRKAREAQPDATQQRLKMAEEQKKKKLEQYDKEAKGGKKDIGTVERALQEKLAQAEADKKKKIENITQMGTAMTSIAHAGTDIMRKAEDEGARRLQESNEEGVSRVTRTERHSDGGTTTTHTSVTTQRTKDGATTSVKQTKQVTQTSGLGGTSYGVSKPSAAGRGRGGARGARSAFQQMDKANTPSGGARPNFLGGGGRGRGAAVQRSPSTVKQMLLDWTKSVTKEYEPKVQITNFSSSWNNGLAFCALIHKFYPDAFNFDELNPKNRRHNFTLAFDTAEQLADIAPLLDVEDMVCMKNPDWKCVFTAVQSYYRRFRDSAPTTPITPISPEPLS